jgi:transposase
MDRSELQRMLDGGLSLAEIGKRVGLHESTVGYWVKTYDLRAANQARHASRGGLTREQLEPMARAGMTIAEIADGTGRSKATVRHWLAKHGLRTNGTRGPRGRAGSREAREAGLHRTMLQCPRHGTVVHVLEPRGYYRCMQCRQDAVIRRRRKVKEVLVEEAGGACQLCGYDRFAGALQFHHLDPHAKEFAIAHRGVARSIERVRAEVQKCVLLCSNCHAEVEHGFSSVSGIAQIGDPG